MEKESSLKSIAKCVWAFCRKCFRVMFKDNITETVILALSLFFLIFLGEQISPMVKTISGVLSALVILRIISLLRDPETKKQGKPNNQDVLAKLHETTNRLIGSTVRLVTMRTFILFIATLIIAIYVKENSDSILKNYSDYIFALSTTLFTIWLVEIIYNSQVDDLNAQRIDQTLMKIFENREWVRQMGNEWRETAISECLIGSFGEELGRKYAQKTIGSQLKQDTYRLSFDYVVSLKEDDCYKNRLIQELSYKKRLNIKQTEQLNISSVFEFEENRFYEPTDNDEVVFFKEEIRSKILKSLLRYSYKIAEKIASVEKKDDIDVQFSKAFEDIVNQICRDVVNSIVRNVKNSETVARYCHKYKEISFVEVCNNIKDRNNNGLISTSVDELEQLHNKVCDEVCGVISDIDNVWYSVVRNLIKSSEADEVKICSEIVRLLINYRCAELDHNGNSMLKVASKDDKVMFIVREDNGDIKDVEISTLKNKELPAFYDLVMGVKFVSEVNPFVENGGVYFYARMTCDYPIHKQNTFYWKFGEPMIGTSFLMSFPDNQDMDLVHAVQYFSDNHQSVTIDKGASTVSFYAEDLLLPESGIYIHWSNRNDTTR